MANNGRKIDQSSSLLFLAPRNTQADSEGSNIGLTKITRRTLCHELTMLPALVGYTIFLPAGVLAAQPITQGEADNVGARIQRTLRPKPTKILRPKLDKDFAVMLMRSSYNVLDDLDCVPMEQFQRDFFIIRSAEYEPYIKNLGYGLVQQGDLTDPYYFDFISFAQYLTINRELTQSPLMVYEEMQPVDVSVGEPQQFVSKIVRRNPDITNDQLVPEHSRRVGAAILDRFEDLYGSTKSEIPLINAGSRPSAVIDAFDQLVKIFLLNGYAWDGMAKIVSSGPKGTEFCLTLISPATIWGGQSLQIGKNKLQNNFLLKAAIELVTRSGFEVASSSVKYEGVRELSYLFLK